MLLVGVSIDTDFVTRYTYQTTDAGTNVENGPEPCEVPAFLVFRGVGHHDCALGGPQETSAHTQECAGEDVETGDILMLRD